MSQMVPEQTQMTRPDTEADMIPMPQGEMRRYQAAGRLAGMKALVTGADSGIGRAVAIGFAKEGADVAICWLNEQEGAARTVELIESHGARALSIPGDIGNSDFCRELVRQVVEEFGRIDILVNTAGEQHRQPNFEEIEDAQIERTFRTNVFGPFFLTRSALPHIPSGGSIINTSSVAAYQGSPELVDYAATKGAIVSFTRSLATALIERNIRVNAVAPGPIRTAPMQRPGQPDEVAPSYIFLASEDASSITGQVLHPNGGTIVNG